MTRHSERCLLAAAFGLLLLSAGWCCRRETVIRARPRAVAWNQEKYNSLLTPAPTTPRRWEPPMAQSMGEQWIFEIFSPPVIRRDPNTGSFVVAAPSKSRQDAAARPITLLAVEAAPYRVQLQGCFGAAGVEVAMLSAVDTREIWCARIGERWPTWGVVLEKLELEGVENHATDRKKPAVKLARATLWDERSGRTVTLTVGIPSLTDELRATLRLASSPRVRHLREGDVWLDGDVSYQIERLSLEPARAEVARISPAHPEGEAFVLGLDVPDADDSEPPTGTKISSVSHNGP